MINLIVINYYRKKTNFSKPPLCLKFHTYNFRNHGSSSDYCNLRNYYIFQPSLFIYSLGLRTTVSKSVIPIAWTSASSISITTYTMNLTGTLLT